jgi:hypothetical protein
MKPGLDVDTRSIKAALKQVELYRDDLIFIEGAGAAVLVNGMRMRVQVKTAATKLSIRSGHFVELSDTVVSDEIGPETEYAPAIEMGIPSKPNYPIQPFVRPTAFEDLPKVVRAIGYAFHEIIMTQWPGTKK